MSAADAVAWRRSADRPTSDRHRLALHPTSLVLAVIGVVVTAVLVSVTAAAHDENENRLLRQRVREAATVLTAALPGIESPLVSATRMIGSDDAVNEEAFRRLMEPLVDAEQPYVSASLWRLDGGDAPELTVGRSSKLATRSPSEVRAWLERAADTNGLIVSGLLDGSDRRLAYGYATEADGTHFVAEVESVLPRIPTPPAAPDSAFGGLDNAVYLQTDEGSRGLLVTNTTDLPLTGRLASEQVPFGDATLLLVMSPDGDLGGRLMALLPWLVGAVGVLTTTAAVVLVERLLRRRDQAEQLSRDNAELFAAQLSVARTLQRSFLPDRLPAVEGLEFVGRYLAGASGVDIGGDWYDVIVLSDERVLAVVGDVSGQGVPAATLMATLRSSVRAFATETDSPAEILERLARLVDLQRDGHFATVLCVAFSLDDHALTIASAGHPSPLLVCEGRAEFVAAPVGTPIGVAGGTSYSATTIQVTPGVTLLMFTDGLFERRGESIDLGMERLRRAVSSRRSSSVEALVDGVVEAQINDIVHDDAALLGVTWTTTTTHS